MEEKKAAVTEKPTDESSTESAFLELEKKEAPEPQPESVEKEEPVKTLPDESLSLKPEEKEKAGESEPKSEVTVDSAINSLVESLETKPEEMEEGVKPELPNKEELYTMSDEKLIGLCKTFGLDPHGRTKHLRERLLDYIERQTGKTEEKSKAKGEKKRSCPNCGKDLSYIEQYDRWYCYACEKYMPI